MCDFSLLLFSFSESENMKLGKVGSLGRTEKIM